MRRRACLLIVAFTAALPLLAQQQPTPDALQVIKAFRRIAAGELWPGFEPGTTPVEFFDGASTYLFNHPSPPCL